MKQLLSILCSSLLLSIRLAIAQPGVLPDAPVFTLDVESFKAEGTIDFDRPFRLVLTSVPAAVTSVQTEIYEGRGSGGPRISITTTPVFRMPGATGTSTVSVIPVVTLRANGHYSFVITLTIPAAAPIVINYGFSLKTKLGDYLKLDLGLGYAPNIKGVFSQTAIHLYFLPINNDVDMATVDGFGRNIFSRASLFVGLSPIKLYSDTEQPIVNASPAGNLVFGVGLRSPFYGKHMPLERNIGWVFLQPLRVNFGQIYFKQDDANPLITRDRNKLTFYFGISYDISIAGLLGPVGKLVNP